MARRGVLGLAVGGAAAMLLTGCGLVVDYPSHRYRITVEVDTPEGLRSGSSVREVKIGEVKSTLGGAGFQVRGEAVAVDLGARGTMFALLRSEKALSWAQGVMLDLTPYPHTAPTDQQFGAWVRAMLERKDLYVLPRDFPPRNPADKATDPPDPSPTAYPMLVRFRDLKDPKTVEKVDPDDMAASFGPGVKLRRITVQLTDDPVTTGLEKRLAWLPKQQGSLVKIPRGVPNDNFPIEQRLNEGDFSWGVLT